MTETSTLLVEDSTADRGRVRWRGPVLVMIAVVAVAIVLAIGQGSRARGLFEPEAPDPSGSKALAVLLADQGVHVVTVRTAQDAADAVTNAGRATLLVAPTFLVTERMAEAVHTARPAHLVLAGPDDITLSSLADWARVDDSEGSTDEVPPDCDWDVAQRAGAIPTYGLHYRSSDPHAVDCYTGAVLELAADDIHPATTIVGPSDAFTNAALADSGNAALTMGALGRDATLVWWLPSASDPLAFDNRESPSVMDLVPRWVPLALLQLMVVVVVVVWWRGRRLGRVVLEPLPVVVRATETVEGRGRLYRRAADRGRAADILRESVTGRLRTLLALPRTASLDVVVPAAAARAGRDAVEVDALLRPGTDPIDDAGLVRLATELDTLEDEVRRS